MSASALREWTGKYLTFDLGEEQFAVDAMQVVGVIRLQNITPLPQCPPFVRGLTNVRGKVVPVISARIRLGLPEVDDTDASCIIMLMVVGTQTGVVVDAVCDVVDINDTQIEPPPAMMANDEVIGLAKFKKRVISILELEKVFSLI